MNPPPTIRPIARRYFALGLLTLCALRLASAAPTELPREGTDWTLADLKLTLLWIKPGTFTMGSPAEERDRNQAEGPRMEVTHARGFWLGRTEVTQEQYAAIAGENPSHFTGVGANAPAEHVSWLDATEFCRKLTARERAAGRLPAGSRYTLPTEAQWEYAFRAGTTSGYVGNADAMAWTAANSGGTTHAVAGKQPNNWGLYDMAGNVLEWCRDWYGNYPGGAQTDPTGPESGYFRIARGGSWRTPEPTGRAAARGGGSPGRRDYTLGFRLALTFGE
jgi:hypothetical protein